MISLRFGLGALLGVFFCSAQGQVPDTLRVLFVGNSYTASYSIPNQVAQLANGSGRHLAYTAHTPGGATFQTHFQNATVQQLLAESGWDAIVLQEQSQVPVIPYYREGITMPFGDSLAAMARAFNPCVRIVYYLTWGRQYGGQQCNGGHCSYPFANFEEYQDSLTWAYERLADSTQAEIAPVGEAWRASLSLDPNLLLHAADQSHPTEAGAHLAAAVIYAALFRDSASLSAWLPANLSTQEVAQLRAVADSVYFTQQTRWLANAPVPPAMPAYEAASQYHTDTLWAWVEWPPTTLPRPAVMPLPAPWVPISDTLFYLPAPDVGAHTWVWSVLYAPNCFPATIAQVVDSAHIQPDTSTGLATPFSAHLVGLYPCPASQWVWVRGLPSAPALFTVLDATGQQVLAGQWFQGEQAGISVGHLPTGLYRLVWQANGQRGSLLLPVLRQ